MKIIFAIPDLGSGGAERVISILCNRFSSLGYAVEVLLFFGERIHYQLPFNVKTTKLNLLKESFPHRILKLRSVLKFIRKGKEQLIIYAFHDSVLNYLLAAKIGITNLKIISAERNNPYIKGISLFSRIKASIPYFLSSHSVFQTNDAELYYFLPKQKCTVIPNPIAESQYKWTGNISPDRLVSVCRLHSQKNIPMSLEIINSLRNQFPNIHLNIYGEGAMKNDIDHLIKQKGLEKHITLKGVTTEVTKILSESSVFISTSDFEGISNSMLEAMSVGMPIVCTDCPIGGASLMLSDGAGILSPVGDVQTFINNLTKVLTNNNLANELAKKAYLTSKKYTPDQIAEKWLAAATAK